MDYLQYLEKKEVLEVLGGCFKPYYKWITFNTVVGTRTHQDYTY